jgi:ribose/xylose/arabinose/galactoside ABC-type transport system permease subunit
VHASEAGVGVSRLLITLGTLFIVAGLAWRWLRHLPLFRLPGDIVIDRPGFKFFFPITTMLIVSAALSILAWLLRR